MRQASHKQCPSLTPAGVRHLSSCDRAVWLQSGKVVCWQGQQSLCVLRAVEIRRKNACPLQGVKGQPHGMPAGSSVRLVVTSRAGSGGWVWQGSWERPGGQGGAEGGKEGRQGKVWQGKG